jgi:hypothetical protein
MRARRTLTTLLAAVYVGWLVWQAPHTVHHFFEHDAEKHNECALNVAAERSSGTTVDVVVIVPVDARERPAEIAAPAFVPRTSRLVAGPRAPPPAVA